MVTALMIGMIQSSRRLVDKHHMNVADIVEKGGLVPPFMFLLTADSSYFLSADLLQRDVMHVLGHIVELIWPGTDLHGRYPPT